MVVNFPSRKFIAKIFLVFAARHMVVMYVLYTLLHGMLGEFINFLLKVHLILILWPDLFAERPFEPRIFSSYKTFGMHDLRGGGPRITSSSIM